VAVGKGKLFWFFSVGFVRWQKPNVLDRAVAFFQLAGNLKISALRLFSIQVPQRLNFTG